jgi:hypothetical protein
MFVGRMVPVRSKPLDRSTYLASAGGRERVPSHRRVAVGAGTRGDPRAPDQSRADVIAARTAAIHR